MIRRNKGKSYSLFEKIYKRVLALNDSQDTLHLDLDF